MIEVDVVVQGSKASGLSMRATTDQLAGAIAQAMGIVVHQRVVTRGDVAGQRVPPSDDPKVRRGRYFRTGGMWGGRTVVKLGMTRAQLLFRGSSPGEAVDGKRPSVPNADKAATVLERHGVNVLALRDTEVEKLGRAVTEAIARSVATAMPVQWTSGPPAATDLTAAFVRAMRA